MIDITTWPPIIVIALGVSPFVIGLSGAAINTYIARSSDFDLMIASLQNCLWVKQQVLFFGTKSLKSRCYLLSTICGAFLYPKISVRLGMFDAEDLRNFPPRLRRRLLVASWLVIVGFVWMMTAAVLIKLFPAT